MDVILERADDLFFDKVYARLIPSTATSEAVSAWPRDYMLRQWCSLYAITLLGVMSLYFLFATFSYYFIFDHRMMKHPRFLKNQVRQEINSSLRTFMPLDFLTTPWFLFEVRGYSKLYESVDEIKGLPLRPLLRVLAPLVPNQGWREAFDKSEAHIGGGWTYLVLSALFFIWFTDLAIYFVHRYEHHPLVYKRIHKPHHKWIIPTPFASHAFHPLDGYAQSLPYHIFVYLFPLHKYLYMGLFVFVNLWSILIHDSEMITDHPLEHIINGPSHHTLHHIYFTCNYGQYLTWADRVGGSYRHPVKGEDPLNAVIAAKEKREAEKRREEESRRLAAALAASLPPSSSSLPSASSLPSSSSNPVLASSSSSSLSPFVPSTSKLLRTPSTKSTSSSSIASGRSSPTSLLFSPAPSSCGTGEESAGTSPEWSEEEGGGKGDSSDEESVEGKKVGDEEKRRGLGLGDEGQRWETEGGEVDGIRRRKRRSGTVVP